MYAQQIAGDYFLFFDRKNAELGLRNIRLEEKPEFTKEKPKKLETDLKNADGKDLGRKVVVLFEDNDGEIGTEAVISKDGGLTLKVNNEAWDYLDVYGNLTVPLNGDGVARMHYGPSSVFS